MTPILRHPALILAALGIVSGSLGTYVPGPGIGDAPHAGFHMMLAGVWFGLVVAFGVWHWGNRSWGAAATAFAATWAGWELAVNLAMQLNEHWLEAVAVPEALRMCVSGFAAGGIGAFLTWAGVAVFTPRLRPAVMPVGVVATGALLGLLLAFTNHYDNAAILLLPWQASIAAILGHGLAPEFVQRHCDIADDAVAATSLPL